jgi:hypothetical protein
MPSRPAVWNPSFGLLRSVDLAMAMVPLRSLLT